MADVLIQGVDDRHRADAQHLVNHYCLVDIHYRVGVHHPVEVTNDWILIGGCHHRNAGRLRDVSHHLAAGIITITRDLHVSKVHPVVAVSRAMNGANRHVTVMIQLDAMSIGPDHCRATAVSGTSP